MKSRSDRLYEIGRETYLSAIPGEAEFYAMLRAVAAMIDEATKPASRGTRPKETKPVVFSPANVFDALEEHCAGKLHLRPYDESSFRTLGRVIKNMPGLEGADLDKLCDWINAGGLDWYKGSATWTHCVRNFSSWVTAARGWAATHGKPAQKDYVAFGGAKQL
jgi:hypothetical protein